MTHGSLFSGIGGFDLAAQWMGWENVFHCELNPFGQKILNHYWPNAKSYEDITKTDFTIHRGTVDIISGGFPCQPFSTAGARKGTDDSRYLWPEMLRVIREVRPRWIVGENVYGLVNWSGGLVFDTVCADLENEGFEVIPVVLPAAGVGSVHRRDRIWFVAYNNSLVRREGREVESGKQSRHGESDEVGNTETTQNTLCSGRAHGEHEQEGTKVRQFGNIGPRGADGIHISKGDAADTDGNPLQGGIQSGGDGEQGWDKQSESITERIHTLWGGMEAKRWENFPTQSPICGGDDGLPTQLDGITFSKWRNESIKGYGNAIVPQIVYTIFQTIEEFEKRNACTLKQSRFV
jgi:DNA (cytosine-5)-methyltransferase 1